MKTKAIAAALGLLAAATWLVADAAADAAHARRSGGGHHVRAANTGGFHYRRGRGWDAGAAASLNAKAAARAAYDARNPEFLYRCYEPQRIWNGAYYTLQFVSIC